MSKKRYSINQSINQSVVTHPYVIHLPAAVFSSLYILRRACPVLVKGCDSRQSAIVFFAVAWRNFKMSCSRTVIPWQSSRMTWPSLQSTTIWWSVSWPDHFVLIFHPSTKFVGFLFRNCPCRKEEVRCAVPSGSWFDGERDADISQFFIQSRLRAAQFSDDEPGAGLSSVHSDACEEQDCTGKFYADYWLIDWQVIIWYPNNVRLIGWFD